MGLAFSFSTILLSAFSFSFSAWGIRPNRMAGAQKRSSLAAALRWVSYFTLGTSCCSKHACTHKHSPTFDILSSPLRTTRPPLRFLTLFCLQWEAIVTNPMTSLPHPPPPQQSVQMTGQMWHYMGLCFLNVKQAPAGHCSIKTQSMESTLNWSQITGTLLLS